MSKYICKICGKEFDRVGNGIYCRGPHYRPCPVCGKPVEFHRPSEPVKCCSRECTLQLADRTKSSHGTKICELCGKEFVPRQANQKYCSGPHVTKCIVCGKDIEYTCYPQDKPNTCSVECANKLRMNTVNIRYGVDNISELDDIKKKISMINSSDAVMRKRINTNLMRYGVDNVSKSEFVRTKLSDIMKSNDVLEKRKQTCRERFGFDSPMQSEFVKSKRKETNYSKYGIYGRLPSKSFYQKIMTDGSKVDLYLKFKADPKSYIQDNYEELPDISMLMSDLGVSETPIYEILVEHGCSDLISRRYSNMENQVVEFIQNLSSNIEIIRNDRNIIKPYELDIYLPEYNMGIECNPMFTHNSTFIDYWGNKPKYYKYHQDKSMLARDNGVFLFHIFGYEWVNKRNIIESMITNLLHKNNCRIGARNTYVCELSNSECNSFLLENHRQGSLVSRIRLGLRLKTTDELVSVMTFGRLRGTMGKSSDATNKDVWELSRFCNKLYTTVSGAASKLFNYFIEHYDYDEIISFSDVAHTRGSLYKTLGFTYDHITSPGYVWVNSDDSIYYHRVSCQKRNLRKLLNDASIDIVNNTEADIMSSHGFGKVYDSGVCKWVYTK